jgi:hypothetical protein
MRIDDPGHAYRAFVAAKDPELRNNLVTKLGRPDFVVNSALQIQSIVSEPKFFTPEIVFIEDALTVGQHEARFAEMLGNLASETPVIVIGLNENTGDLRTKFPNNRLMFLKRMPERFDEAVLEKVLPSIKAGTGDTDFGATRIPQSDDLSFAEVSLPARLVNVHPNAIKIALPYDIGRFGLAHVWSPVLNKVLGREAWIKITDSFRSGRDGSAPFTYHAEGIISDCSTADQQRMARKLTELVQTHFDEIFSAGDSDPTGMSGLNRTPELGSVRRVPSKAVPSAQSEVHPVVASQVLPRSQQNIYAAQSAVALHIREVDLTIQHPVKPVEVPLEFSMAEIEISGEPEIGGFGEKAKDIAQNVYENVTSKNFKRTVIFIAFSAFVLAVALALVYAASDSFSHSGSVYTEELYKFAPHLKKKPVGLPAQSDKQESE